MSVLRHLPKLVTAERSKRLKQHLRLVRLLAACVTATFCGAFHFGYQMTSVNTAAVPIRAFINDSFASNYNRSLTADEMGVLWSVVAGIPLLAAVPGCLVAPLISNSIGRRNGLLLSSIALIVSSVPCALAQFFGLFELLLAGRVLGGISVGVGSVIQATYITEISPGKLTGRLNALVGVQVRVSMLLATVLGTAAIWGTPQRWPNIFLLQAGVALLQAAAVLALCPETPNFLLLRGKVSAAEAVIWSVTPGISAVGLNQRLLDCQNDVDNSRSAMGIVQLLRTSEYRPCVLHATVVGLFASMSGVTALSNYSTLLLIQSGASESMSAYMSVCVALAGLLAAVACVFIIQRVSQYRLLLATAAGVTVIDVLMWLLLGVTAAVQLTAGWVVTALFLLLQTAYMVVFSLGVGPISLVLGAQLVPLKARAANQSVGAVAVQIGGWLSPQLFLPVQRWVGPHAFALLAAPAAALTVYVWLAMRHAHKISPA